MSNVGRLIYGYCDGYFGRDHYHTARIEAEGPDWFVVRSVDGRGDARPELAWFLDDREKEARLAAWSSESERMRWTQEE